MICYLSEGVPQSILFESLFQGDGTVVLFVAGGVDEGDIAFAAAVLQQSEQVRVAFQLVPVAAAEFFPFLRIVSEPLAQFGAGGEALEPEVDFGILLLDAARP